MTTDTTRTRPDSPVPAPRRPLRARLAAPAGTLAAVAGALVYVGVVDPNQPGRYPVCPLLRLTGVFCPGCGGLRSAHAVAHGDFGTAWGANALVVAAIAAFVVVWFVWFVRSARSAGPVRIAGVVDIEGTVRIRRLRAAHGWVLAGALLAVFTLIRNLPFGEALTP